MLDDHFIFLQTRTNRAVLLYKEIKQLSTLLDDAKALAVCAHDCSGPSLSETLLCEILRLGAKGVLEYKFDEFSKLVSTDPIHTAKGEVTKQ